MRIRNLLSLILTLLLASATFAQTAKVKGRVMDSTGSVMPGVQVKLYEGENVVKEGVTNDTGDFELPANPGDYKLEVAAPDFNTYTEMVKVTPDMGPLSVTMQLAIITQNVEFRDESLNARDPFLTSKDGSIAKRPPSQTRNFQSNFSGPIIRNKLSLNLNVRRFFNENTNTIRATLPGSDGVSQFYSAPSIS